jgi:GTPase SAR1 family protein
LTKKDNNPNILDLFQFVTNEFFDKRNVFAKKFPANAKEIEDIHNFFLKCMYYYNEVRDSENDVQVHTFNILVCGVAGVGKSSFIKQFLKEKLQKKEEV